MAAPDTVRSRLVLQGFACDADPGIAANARWLRVTPSLSTLWIVLGTALRSPELLWAFAVVSAAGAAGWHPFDAAFNGLAAPLVGAPRLPRNPAPRRFAMALAAAWSAAAGALMADGFTAIGVAAGAALAFAGLLVATTHFCLGSWVYRLVRSR